MIDHGRLEDILREAGAMALGRWPGHGHALKSWEKEPGSPVCEADIAVDTFLKRELHALLPSAGWLSEETVDHPERLGKGLCWLVDPIDGTRDFIRGRPGWAVSVALVVDGAPEFGVLYAPALDELWVAQRGQGAMLNGETLHASQRCEFSGSRVPADALPRVDSDLVIVTKPNSIALRMALVADDRADLVATLRWGFEWDVAAAALIATEAGAMVTDAFGEPLAFNTPRAQAFGVIACAPGIHRAVVDRLHDRAVALTTKT